MKSVNQLVVSAALFLTALLACTAETPRPEPEFTLVPPPSSTPVDPLIAAGTVFADKLLAEFDWRDDPCTKNFSHYDSTQWTYIDGELWNILSGEVAPYASRLAIYEPSGALVGEYINHVDVKEMSYSPVIPGVERIEAHRRAYSRGVGSDGEWGPWERRDLSWSDEQIEGLPNFCGTSQSEIVYFGEEVRDLVNGVPSTRYTIHLDFNWLDFSLLGIEEGTDPTYIDFDELDFSKLDIGDRATPRPLSEFGRIVQYWVSDSGVLLRLRSEAPAGYHVQDAVMSGWGDQNTVPDPEQYLGTYRPIHSAGNRGYPKMGPVLRDVVAFYEDGIISEEEASNILGIGRSVTQDSRMVHVRASAMSMDELEAALDKFHAWSGGSCDYGLLAAPCTSNSEILIQGVAKLSLEPGIVELQVMIGVAIPDEVLARARVHYGLEAPPRGPSRPVPAVTPVPSVRLVPPPTVAPSRVPTVVPSGSSTPPPTASPAATVAPTPNPTSIPATPPPTVLPTSVPTPHGDEAFQLMRQAIDLQLELESRPELRYPESFAVVRARALGSMDFIAPHDQRLYRRLTLQVKEVYSGSLPSLASEDFKLIYLLTEPQHETGRHFETGEEYVLILRRLWVEEDLPPSPPGVQEKFVRLKPDEADVVGGDIYGYAGIFVHLENEVAEFWHMEFRTPRSGSHPEEEGPFEITTTVSNVVEAIQSITEPTGLYDYLDVWPEPSALQLASYRAIDMIWGEYDAVARVRIRAPHEYKKVSWAISGWPQGPRPSGQTWIRTKAEVQAVYGGELPGSIDLVNIYRDIHPNYTLDPGLEYVLFLRKAWASEDETERDQMRTYLDGEQLWSIGGEGYVFSPAQVWVVDEALAWHLPLEHMHAGSFDSRKDDLAAAREFNISEPLATLEDVILDRMR